MAWCPAAVFNLSGRKKPNINPSSLHEFDFQESLCLQILLDSFDSAEVFFLLWGLREIPVTGRKSSVAHACGMAGLLVISFDVSALKLFLLVEKR